MSSGNSQKLPPLPAPFSKMYLIQATGRLISGILGQCEWHINELQSTEMKDENHRNQFAELHTKFKNTSRDHSEQEKNFLALYIFLQTLTPALKMILENNSQRVSSQERARLQTLELKLDALESTSRMLFLRANACLIGLNSIKRERRNS